jgi:hypothetical protein
MRELDDEPSQNVGSSIVATIKHDNDLVIEGDVTPNRLLNEVLPISGAQECADAWESTFNCKVLRAKAITPYCREHFRSLKWKRPHHKRGKGV